MARSKPNMEELWAETGAKIDPRTQYSDADKIKKGWLAEIPLHESENWEQNRQDEFLAHVNDFGIIEWDAVTDYADKALIRSAVDGEKYLSVQAVPAGNVDPANDDGTYWILINFSSLSQNGVKLYDIDMTNGGANDLNNIDIAWQGSWDAYDYIEVIIDDAESSNTGQVAFALSSDGGSTWEQFSGSANESVSWTGTTLGSGEIFSGVMSMYLNTRHKVPMCKEFNCESASIKDASTASYQGVVFNYNGTSLSSPNDSDKWNGWLTPSNGLSTYTLRFTHEVGNFTSGTLKIIGYTNP